MIRVVGVWVNVLILVLFVCTFSLKLFANKVISDSGSEKQSTITSDNIIVLRENDPEPMNASRVNAIEVSPKDPAYKSTYADLIRTAKLMALNADANIIRITEVKAKNKANIHDYMKATLYRAEDPKRYETSFSWSPNRKLTWDDFRGPMQHNATENTAAATFCGIGFETNTLNANNNKVKIHVYNTFYTNRSWVRRGEEKASILAHEQGHFDLCEIYTRILRQRLNNAQVDVYTLNTTLKGIYREVQQEYLQRQEQYENETEHGLIHPEQQRWQQMIAMELNQSLALAEN